MLVASTLANNNKNLWSPGTVYDCISMFWTLTEREEH